MNLARGGHLFALPAFLEPALTKTLGELQLRNLLLALDSHQFAQNAAYFLGELNAAHPFREGNGRTQREFIRQLGLNAGHNVDWRSATRESMIDASQRSHVHGDSAPFASLILRCMRLTG